MSLVVCMNSITGLTRIHARGAARSRLFDRNMDDGLAIGVGAAPAWQAVERGDRGRLDLQQGPGDMVAVEKTGERSGVALFGGDVRGEKIVAVHLDPPVDKDGHAGEDQIAAKGFAVENGAGEIQALRGGERFLRRHRIAGANRWV